MRCRWLAVAGLFPLASNGWVDTLTLSADGKTSSGTHNHGNSLQSTRH